MRSWMIRHHDFTFTRPMPESEIVARIESGEVTAHDEIAASDGYWFSIQEVEEVQKYFGDIHLHALLPQGIETTSSTNTALLAPSIKPPPKKISYDLEASRLETPRIKMLEPATSNETGPSQKAFGFILALLFLGTLLLLWLGSQ